MGDMEILGDKEIRFSRLWRVLFHPLIPKYLDNLLSGFSSAYLSVLRV